MTISEASAVNVVLSHILGGSSAGEIEPSREAVQQAAISLADRASKALMAGWDGNRVQSAIEKGYLQ